MTGSGLWSEQWVGRGAPWEFDPGPAPGSALAAAFAHTPNYRGMGLRWSGQEMFRWHFGPMFYRGRLGGGAARVLVVGQEGAQDESLSHRSFTGGTGGRMQYLLGHLGITSSYLFLNTFVYPIFGQYDDPLRPLAQDPRSPVVQHRHRVFDAAVAEHPLRLVIAVGTAAKETVATWIRAHGGTADPASLHTANAGVCAPGLRAVGVLHPGGAGKGGSVSAIIASFTQAAQLVAQWSAADVGWLPPDADGVRRPATAYKYKAAPIPFRDLPYGTPWRLGFGSTASNRRDGQTAIQLFSSAGAYNNTGTEVAYPALAAGSREGYTPDPTDLPYEPPRAHPDDHDAGPPPDFATLLQGGLPGLAWPDFTALGLPAHPSFGYGPVYRGRLTSPSVLVLADQTSHDDLFLGRALCGAAGQHLQGFLRAAGLTTRYAVLRTLPVDSLSATASVTAAAVRHPAVQAILREALRRSAPRLVLTLGPHAAEVAASLAPAGVEVLALRPHGAAGWLQDWQHRLADLATRTIPLDAARSSWDGTALQIARRDLPYGVLRWQGTSGDRVVQAVVAGAPSPDYFKIVMPGWAASSAATPLSAAERAAVESLRA